ncbi:molybdenum cofactor cytidylyltransferase [Dehalobacterium formicoaceticum]|uniref:Molybdenum cofactor cytidylyltransferase n=1 Tax=Dehalobacterium formicoaceticum TaxID=51515 RepID=A0ABT1Y111_9FIRM|nr:molybdenum cofactor cytidylyltransferase [Dehalobacterium formicoaceticum]MCR6544549.1 molybdenum cofactor cytidylyltransferase [Dehalobacterium formicoaceticum]
MGKIKAMILAAGFSSRMKTNKMLLPLGEMTIIENTLQGFLQSEVDGVAVVLGHDKEKIARVLTPYPVQFIENPRFSQGMSTSVQAGIEQLQGDQDLDGVMITPGDMPFIQAKTVDGIIKIFREFAYPIIIPLYQGRRGHPVFFAKELMPQLLAVSGDMGARGVIRSNPEKCFFLEVDDPGILIDMDAPEEYDKWRDSGLNPKDIKEIKDTFDIR